MRQLLTVGLCVLLSILPGRAQGAEEASFRRDAAKKLNAYASLCFSSGFPRLARETWLEIISEYDVDDAVARENLGFARVGSSWAPEVGFEYPDGDRPDGAAARALQRRWEALTEELGEGHREVALKSQALGLHDNATYHFNRTLRFLPNDPIAAEARGLQSFEGLYGTPTQLELLKRSRLMERKVIALAEQTYDVEILPPEASHPWIELAGIEHHGVRSEHFTIWGDLEQDVLVEIANFSERALEFCQEAFAGYESFPADAGIVRTYVYLQSRETWKTAVEANRHRLPDRVDFVLEFAHSTSFGFGRDRIHISGHEGRAIVYDLAVRWVVEDYAGLTAPALKEGVGHAVVGMFFGRNLVFSIAPEKRERTASGQLEQKPLMPDMASWAELAGETAWQKTDVPAPRLPLIPGSAMSDEARIKAWSFSDYLLRRDPELLEALDRTAIDGARHEGEVIEKYEEAAGVSILELDAAWRRFWTEDTPLYRAIHKKNTPLEAVSKAAPAWLEEFNELREKYGSERVGWSAALSTACKQHAEYLKANRGAWGFGAANTQEPGSEGYSNAGRTFAETAIVSTRGTRPERVMEDWVDLPGFRNALLNHDLRNIGLYVDGPIAVFDVEKGWRRTNSSRIEFYPSPLNDVRDPVPREFDVQRLGPGMESLVRRRAGRARGRIGYPISIHFFRVLPRGRDAVQCTVTVDGEPVDGFLHRAYESGHRPASAEGMLVFYPYEPLPRNVEVNVLWSFRTNEGSQKRVEYVFFTR